MHQEETSDDILVDEANDKACYTVPLENISWTPFESQHVLVDEAPTTRTGSQDQERRNGNSDAVAQPKPPPSLARMCLSIRTCLSSLLPCGNRNKAQNNCEEVRPVPPTLAVQICDSNHNIHQRRSVTIPIKQKRHSYNYEIVEKVLALMQRQTRLGVVNLPAMPASVRSESLPSRIATAEIQPPSVRDVIDEDAEIPLRSVTATARLCSRESSRAATAENHPSASQEVPEETECPRPVTARPKSQRSQAQTNRAETVDSLASASADHVIQEEFECPVTSRLESQQTSRTATAESEKSFNNGPQTAPTSNLQFQSHNPFAVSSGWELPYPELVQGEPEPKAYELLVRPVTARTESQRRSPRTGAVPNSNHQSQTPFVISWKPPLPPSVAPVVLGSFRVSIIPDFVSASGDQTNSECKNEDKSCMQETEENEPDCLSNISSKASHRTTTTTTYYMNNETGTETCEEECSLSPRPKTYKRDKQKTRRNSVGPLIDIDYYGSDADGEYDDSNNQAVACYISESKTEVIKIWNPQSQEMRKALKSPTKKGSKKKRLGSAKAKKSPRRLTRLESWSSAPADPVNSTTTAHMGKSPASESGELKNSARIPKIFHPTPSPALPPTKRVVSHSRSEMIMNQDMAGPDEIMHDILTTVHQASWGNADIYCYQLKQLARYAPFVLGQHISSLVDILLRKVRDRRSRFAGPGVKILRRLYDSAPRFMLPMYDVVIHDMLDKLGGPLYIDTECMTLLQILAAQTEPISACLSFAKYGVGHRMSVTRSTAARFLAEETLRLDVDIAIGDETRSQKRLTSALFEAATCFIYDASGPTREYGRNILRVLLVHEKFWRLYFKHVPHELKKEVNTALDEVRGLRERSGS